MILQMIYPHWKAAKRPSSCRWSSPRPRRRYRWTNQNSAISSVVCRGHLLLSVSARVATLIGVIALGTGISAHASDLPAPTGEILLTISGNISKTNHADGAAFDLEMLEAMESTTIETKTPWTKGVTTFTGVPLEQLLESLGTSSRMLKMSAADGYIYEPLKPIESKYPVIVAYKKDDDYMSLRQLGPLWVMYPFDDYPELDTEENRAACVWQLQHIEVK